MSRGDGEGDLFVKISGDRGTGNIREGGHILQGRVTMLSQSCEVLACPFSKPLYYLPQLTGLPDLPPPGSAMSIRIELPPKRHPDPRSPLVSLSFPRTCQSLSSLGNRLKRIPAWLVGRDQHPNGGSNQGLSLLFFREILILPEASTESEAPHARKQNCC